MGENSAETLEQVPKGRRGDSPIEDAGQAIVAKIQRAADLANENCDESLTLLSTLLLIINRCDDYPALSLPRTAAPRLYAAALKGARESAPLATHRIASRGRGIGAFSNQVQLALFYDRKLDLTA